MPLIGSFLLFAGVVMLGMTVVAMSIWGPYLVEFKNLQDAYMAVILFSMGKPHSEDVVGLLDFE